MTEHRARLVGLYAAAAAIGAALLAPLLALSYFRVGDGAEELEQGTVSAWADPAGERLDALLTWSSPDRVYSTYVQAMALLFPAVLLCALAVRRTRSAPRGAEKWGWRIALPGYGLALVGIVAAFFTLIPGDSGSGAVNAVFLGLMVPGMLITTIGSTVLGIGLLRAGYAPRLAAWLLALALPFQLVGTGVVGHNSVGMVPLFVAWGVAGLALARGAADHPADARAPLADLQEAGR